LSQQGFNQFIGHPNQRNIALCNPIIDLVHLSKTVDSSNANEDGQETTGQKSQEQFVGYGQAKVPNLIVFH